MYQKMHIRYHDCLIKPAVQFLQPPLRDSRYLRGPEENPLSDAASNMPCTEFLRGCRNMPSAHLSGHYYSDR